MFLRITVHTFQYPYIVYMFYYFQNKRIDISDTYTRIVSVHHRSRHTPQILKKNY